MKISKGFAVVALALGGAVACGSSSNPDSVDGVDNRGGGQAASGDAGGSLDASLGDGGGATGLDPSAGDPETTAAMRQPRAMRTAVTTLATQAAPRR